MPMMVFAYATAGLVTDGDAAAGPSVVKINQEYLGDHCEFCLKIEYNPYLAGKAGIAMKSSTPLDVQTPQRLILWARGEYGDEKVRFMLLGKQNGTASSSQDANLFDNVEFVSKTETVTLTTHFKIYQIDVPNVDPERFNDVTHLSAIEIDDGNGMKPVIVYVKGFVYDTKQPDPIYEIENEEIAADTA